MKNLLLTLTLVISTIACMQSHAYEEGDWIVRFGATTVDPDEDSDAVDVLGVHTFNDGINVGSSTQLGITATYMLSSNIGIELLAATPFNHDVTLKGTGIKVGETDHLPPTLTVHYYFMPSDSKFQPYVGAGINYTTFFSEDIDDELNAGVDGLAGLPEGTADADLEVDDSLGLALHAGMDYELSENWVVNASIWHIDIDTEVTIKTALGNVSFDVEIDPMVYMIGAGYRF